MRFYRLAAKGFVAFLDFGIGTMLVSLMGAVLGHEVQWWQCLIGGILALAPDLDVVWMFANREGVYTDHHQFITHRPIFGIGVAAIVGYLTGGFFWMATASTCLCWHYVHDTEGFGGGGIAWLWPICGKYICFSGFKDPRQSIMVEGVGGEAFNEWLDDVWLRPSRTSVTHLGIGALAIGSAAAIFAGSWWGLTLALLPAIAVAAIWATYRRKKPTR